MALAALGRALGLHDTRTLGELPLRALAGRTGLLLGAARLLDGFGAAALGVDLTATSVEAEPAHDVEPADAADRKSVVAGKSVAVRVDLGGRRIVKKQKNNHI